MVHWLWEMRELALGSCSNVRKNMGRADLGGTINGSVSGSLGFRWGILRKEVFAFGIPHFLIQMFMLLCMFLSRVPILLPSSLGALQMILQIFALMLSSSENLPGFSLGFWLMLSILSSILFPNKANLTRGGFCNCHLFFFFPRH